MRDPLFKFALIGSLFSIILGAALHFVFEWSNFSPIVAPIAAVNESTWEHMKLGFWPLLIWALVEYYFFKLRSKNFVIAKSISIAVYCVLVPTLFYIYSAVLGDHYLALDIAIFVISIFIGQYIGYKILAVKKELNLERTGAFVTMILLFAFVLFTFFPPEIFLFEDPVDGGYGITSH